MKYRISTSNERVWCTMQLGLCWVSTIQSVVLTADAFQFFIKRQNQKQELASPPQWWIDHNLDLAARPNELRNVWGVGIYLLIVVFRPQRAPLTPLWPLRAPTWTTPFITCQRAFSLFPFLFWNKSLLFPNFCFRGPFLNERAYCRRATTAYTAHSKAQSALHKAPKYVPTIARQRKQADRVGESQHVVEHLYSSLRSQNERRNRNLPGQIYSNHSQSSWSWFDARRNHFYFQSQYSSKMQHWSFSPSSLCISYVHASRSPRWRSRLSSCLL